MTEFITNNLTVIAYGITAFAAFLVGFGIIELIKYCKEEKKHD